MSPMLRGEALPLPAKELAGLRDQLERNYGDRVVPTSAGPLLAIRVPHREPDFLRDLESAVDVLPYRDLRGYRGVLLVGDKHHMGVSIDMLRSLLEAREHSLRDWIKKMRATLAPGDFQIGRLPTDPQRRLRVVFRVHTESVTELEEPDFDALAEILADVKAAAPGQMRPAFAYLVGESDHVQLDAGVFFTDLERRRRYNHEREATERRRELDERHELALIHLERIMKERGEPAVRRRAAAELQPPRPAAARTPPARPTRPAAAPPRTHHPVDDLDLRDRAPRSETTAPLPRAPAAPAAPSAPPTPPRPAEPDHFTDMARHPETVVAIRKALDAAGYKTKHRLMVRDVPFAFAAARPDGYPTRVLVTFRRRLDAETAHKLILVGRSVGAELVLAVSEEVAPEAHKVVLATHVKPLTPEAALDVRFG